MAVMVLLNDDAETLRALRAIRTMMEIPPVGPHATVADLVRVIWEDLARLFECEAPRVVNVPADDLLLSPLIQQFECSSHYLAAG